MPQVAAGVKLPVTTFIGDSLQTADKKENRVQMSLRLDAQLHEQILVRMAPRRLKFQTLVELLMERWVTGEFDRKDDRPITSVEAREDAEILRIVHHPADRAEKLVSETVKHYLGLLEEDRRKAEGKREE